MGDRNWLWLGFSVTADNVRGVYIRLLSDLISVFL